MDSSPRRHRARTGQRPATADLVPAAPSRFGRPSLVTEQRSQFLTYLNVEYDVFAANPLIEDLKLTSPSEYEAALVLETIAKKWRAGHGLDRRGVDQRTALSTMTAPSRK